MGVMDQQLQYIAQMTMSQPEVQFQVCVVLDKTCVKDQSISIYFTLLPDKTSV